MCTVSMIADHYGDRYRDNFKQIAGTGWAFTPPVTRAEFDALKRDVAEMKELLKRAKAYDERNNEPECETDEKMAKLRKMAELVGIDIDDVIGKAAQP